MTSAFVKEMEGMADDLIATARQRIANIRSRTTNPDILRETDQLEASLNMEANRHEQIKRIINNS